MSTIESKCDMQFVHIAKNAGTSVEDLGVKHGCKWGRFDDRLKAGNADRKHHCSVWHDPTVKYEKDTFCIVRDPVERIVSEYKYRDKVYNESKGCDRDEMNKWIVESLTKYEGGNTGIHDCHLIPQSKFLQVCNHVYDFENLSDDFEGIPRNNTTDRCTLSIDDLYSDTISRIETTYKEDIEFYKAFKEKN